MNQVFLHGYEIIQNDMTELATKLDYIEITLIVIALLLALDFIRRVIVPTMPKF